MSCDAAIRPFRPVNDTEVVCDQQEHKVRQTGPGRGEIEHRGVIEHYAYPGSRTVVRWFEDDRRNFHEGWPGSCLVKGCILPIAHEGSHAI